MKNNFDMKNINIGIANLFVTKKLKDAYFNNSMLEESKTVSSDFFEIVKNSPILQLEYKVFNNIESKHIDNDLTASRYIDNNIKCKEIVQFVYPVSDGSSDKWRKIGIFEENNDYIKGYDLNDDNKFKCFKKNKILENKIIRTQI